MEIKIYTDGSCLQNGAENVPAGWAFIVVSKNDTYQYYAGSGIVENGTNNIGELTAIIKALQWVSIEINPKALPKLKEVSIYSDSAYCINGITDWRFNWKKYGWFRDSRQTKELKNKELWIQLDELIENLSFLKINWIKVKGHVGDKWNEQVDLLAKEAICKQ